MLAHRTLAVCVGAFALALSALGAAAAPMMVPSGGLTPSIAPGVTLVRGGGGFGGGFHGGGGFHAGGFHGGGFHGGGFHGGGFRGFAGGYRGGFHGYRPYRARGYRHFGGYYPYYAGYGYGDDCWWSGRRHRWVCS